MTDQTRRINNLLSNYRTQEIARMRDIEPYSSDLERTSIIYARYSQEIVDRLLHENRPHINSPGYIWIQSREMVSVMTAIIEILVDVDNWTTGNLFRLTRNSLIGISAQAYDRIRFLVLYFQNNAHEDYYPIWMRNDSGINWINPDPPLVQSGWDYDVPPEAQTQQMTGLGNLDTLRAFGVEVDPETLPIIQPTRLEPSNGIERMDLEWIGSVTTENARLYIAPGPYPTDWREDIALYGAANNMDVSWAMDINLFAHAIRIFEILKTEKNWGHMSVFALDTSLLLTMTAYIYNRIRFIVLHAQSIWPMDQLPAWMHNRYINWQQPAPEHLSQTLSRIEIREIPSINPTLITSRLDMSWNNGNFTQQINQLGDALQFANQQVDDFIKATLEETPTEPEQMTTKREKRDPLQFKQPEPRQRKSRTIIIKK